jgi:hypothetical protein
MTIDRDEWPVPDEIKGNSGRDAFLWYICDGWGKFMGGDEPIETLLDNDFGHHILRRGEWQLTLEYKGIPANVDRTVLWTGNTLSQLYVSDSDYGGFVDGKEDLSGPRPNVVLQGDMPEEMRPNVIDATGPEVLVNGVPWKQHEEENDG